MSRRRSLLIRDSQGKPSWTMTLSVPAIFLITIKFLVGPFEIDFPGQWKMVIGGIDGVNYAAAIAPFIGLVGWRMRTKEG